MSHRRRVRLRALRLRLAAAQRHADDRRSWGRRRRLPRSGGPRDRPPEQTEGLRAPGSGPRYRRGQREARLQGRPPQLRDRRADSARPGTLVDPGADEQSDEAGRPRRLRARDRGAAADRAAAVGRESGLSRRQAGQARPLPHPLIVPHKAPSAARTSNRQRRVAIIVSRFHENITTKLLDGAREALRRGGIADSNVEVTWAPGAFELPVLAGVAVSQGRAPRGVYGRGADVAAKAIAGLPEFDRRIADAAEHWRLERVGAIERNILRLALAELDEASTPSRVVIDEAVKLAHWFAGSRAPAFINGVLDAIAHETGAL